MTDETARILYKKYCFTTVLNKTQPNDGKVYCGPLWDSWGCWDYTLAGTTAFINCPSHNPGFDPSLLAHRHCTEDGTWWIHPRSNKTWGNYTQCVNQDHFKSDVRQLYFFIAGYSISLAFLLASLIIFCSFRQLQCDRVTNHKHMFFSYVLSNVVFILYYSLTALDVSVQNNNPVWCQVLHVLSQYFVQCNFYWMFCEGFYLHTIIVLAFISGRTLMIFCYIIGWGLPLVFTTVYAAIRATRPSESSMCWISDSSLMWIVATPIVISILANLFFLCNVLKVLLTKLRSALNPDTNCYRKAARATLILIPLLGLQFILFPMKYAESGIVYEIYVYAIAFVVSFQGTFVSLIFCFFNGEVHTVIKRQWGQHRLMTANPPRSTYFTSVSDQQVSSSRSILKSSKERKESAMRKSSASDHLCLVDCTHENKTLH